MIGHIAAFALGAIGTYWVSDTVKNNIHQIYQDTQAILENNEKFQERFYEKLIEVEKNGELPIILSKLKQQGLIIEQNGTMSLTPQNIQQPIQQIN